MPKAALRSSVRSHATHAIGELKNIFIFLPSKKTLSFLQNWTNKYYSTKQNNLLKYNGSSLQIWRNKYFCYSTKQKTSLNILDLHCRIEEIDMFYYSTNSSSRKTLPNWQILALKLQVKNLSCTLWLWLCSNSHSN